MIENVFLGVQGWKHPEWIGRVYATSIPSANWLGEYAQRYSTVEVDDTFYGIPPEPVLRQWREDVPRGFSFALKVPQQVTHEQSFPASGGLLTRFLNRVSLLGDNLGAILLIAPPGFRPDESARSRLRRFLEHLPADFRWALEVKHGSWLGEELREIASSKNVAIVTGENRWIPRKSLMQLFERPTADFAYVRWGGRIVTGQVGSANGDHDVRAAGWTEPLARLSGLVGSVYGYFQIGAFGDGLLSVDELQRSIGKRTPAPDVP